VSDVIRLSAGYGLIKLTEIRAGHTPTFEEARIRVLRRYDDERYDQQVQAIAQAARERVKPVVHYELLDQVKLE
jgi:parvulin-like peptidyl-prolyl isomerase